MVVMHLSKSNGGVADTINNFLEEILCHVVGFIDLKLIVHTGILSKKWRKVDNLAWSARVLTVLLYYIDS
ncbi:hypothetical protein L6164_001121 [Bauhinia variegata]|uniref:Uncharacterized protein n=1 Tax=Bauhinia variegata TaxID=167791 RepID=A0ACB9QAQ2_BAUVA|nr:hypothetical protein L6164_001121 [Bauhinia variegata]